MLLLKLLWFSRFKSFTCYESYYFATIILIRGWLGSGNVMIVLSLDLDKVDLLVRFRDLIVAIEGDSSIRHHALRLNIRLIWLISFGNWWINNLWGCLCLSNSRMYTLWRHAFGSNSILTFQLLWSWIRSGLKLRRLFIDRRAIQICLVFIILVFVITFQFDECVLNDKNLLLFVPTEANYGVNRVMLMNSVF